MRFTKQFLLQIKMITLSLLLPAITFSSIPAALHAAVKTETRLITGYDSFIDRYTILEKDTTEALNEYYIAMQSRLSSRELKFEPEISNSFKFGNQTIDDRLYLNFKLGNAKVFQTELSAAAFLKHFREQSDYTFSNNYRQYNTTLRLGVKIKDKLKINSRTRAELVDYDEYTDFDYDYNYLESGIEIFAGEILDDLLRFSTAFGANEAPDTTELSFDRGIVEADAYISPGGMVSCDLSLSADRRKYKGTARSSSWMIIYFSRLKLSKGDKVESSINIEGESLSYDNQTSTYFNTHFLRWGLGVSLDFREMGKISIQPKYGRLFCPDLAEERYEEYSFMLGYEIFAGNSYWLSLSYEPGMRNYLTESSGVYSDFYLNRISIMGSISAVNGITANLFLIHDPEYHSRREDDFSITLISLSLSRTF